MTAPRKCRICHKVNIPLWAAGGMCRKCRETKYMYEDYKDQLEWSEGRKITEKEEEDLLRYCKDRVD